MNYSETPASHEPPQHDSHVRIDREYWRLMYERQEALLRRHPDIVALRSFVRLSLFGGRMEIDLDRNDPNADEDRRKIMEIMSEEGADSRYNVEEHEYDIWRVRQ